MRITPHTVENQINGLYTRLGVDHEGQHCRVSAAKWYWSHKMGLRHNIIEAEQLPVVVEVGGNREGISPGGRAVINGRLGCRTVTGD